MRLSIIPFLLCLLPAFAQQAELRTPPPGKAPRINGPSVYGVRPGKPFLYRIPCTGERPVRFTAKGLPQGISLDGATGILSGKVPARKGEYRVQLGASNGAGKDGRLLRIVVGDTLALTPPMGWNDWYTHYTRITDKLMRQGADAMIASGMADAGYQYVNIDDCWSRKAGSTDPEIGGEPRGPNGEILTNARFPDMKGLTDYIHSKGLKAGIYSSPGPATCAKFVASWQHEEQDARTFAAWGFDFLKYDWCTYGSIAKEKSLVAFQTPYKLMGGILPRLDRDVVFNLCQYGMGDVWKWGAEVGGHSWRTTGDLGLEKDSRLPGFYTIGLRNAKLHEFAGPGRWNDPDYLLIGTVGDARNQSAPPKPVALTADEQYSYMSMWSLMAAPLFYSGDMNHLDELTLNILTNTEIIAINQDALGRQAHIVRQNEDELVLVKPLEGGAVAFGLFNLSQAPRKMRVTAKETGIKDGRELRDAWRQKVAGKMGVDFEATVARHGVEVFIAPVQGRRQTR
ncbi:MAG TPA: putative Ig domain-containing protein [Bryobacteraceae bacterium]|nr:putative Ig domain-containing protein [Bryobacteraceae bacterium]